MAKRTRDVTGAQRRYAWRLYPMPEQTDALMEQLRMCVLLWNALLEMCERRNGRAVQRHGRSVSFHCAACASASADGKIVLCEAHRLPTEFDMGYWLSELRAECPEWRALSTWTPRRVAGSLFAAYKAFFRRAKAGAGSASGYPRFKSARRANAIPHRCLSGCAILKSDRHERSWIVRLKGVPGEIWARGRVPGEPHEWMDADVRFVAGRWEISAAVSLDERRESRGTLHPTVVRFDLIDGFAAVNEELQMPEGLIHAMDLDDRRASMQASFDLRWPRGKRLTDEEWQERREEWMEIARLAARAARVRANALHVWSKRTVERASVLTIYRPAVQECTSTPRGNEKEWGASVETVSALNRRALSYAPAMAAKMLEYKAREIGIPIQVFDDTAPGIAIGEKLVAAGKAARKAKRAIEERNDNEHHRQRTGRAGRGHRRGDGASERGHAA
jgi:hypothetical protein